MQRCSHSPIGMADILDPRGRAKLRSNQIENHAPTLNSMPVRQLLMTLLDLSQFSELSEASMRK